MLNRFMLQAGIKFYDTFHEEITELLYLGYKDNILHNPRLVMYKMHGTTKDGITIEKKHVRNIMGTINALKMRGLVQNNWTIDTTRSIVNYSSFEDKEDGLDALAKQFHLDRWESQPRKLLLMCEAAGYLGVIKNISDEFRVPYLAAKGDMSVQLKMELADMMAEPTTILYYGDYDPKGIEIPKIIEADIRAMNPGADFEMVRMFIDASDIAKYGLIPDRKGNVQMEQLPAHIAIQESKDYIYEFMDMDAWKDTKVAEEKIREELEERTKRCVS